MLHFYHVCRSHFGHQWQYTRLAGAKRTRPIQPTDLDLLPFWFNDTRSLQEPQIGLIFLSGLEDNHWKEPAFMFHFDHIYDEYPRGVFRLCLPADYATSNKQAFSDMLLDLFKTFPLEWGFVGHSFLWNYLLHDIDSRVKELMHATLVRHPGFAYGEEALYQATAEEGVGHIGWITLLGDENVQRVGGLSTLESAVRDTGVQLIKVGDHAVGLQAGDEPDVGDVNCGNDLPLRRKVGDIVEPARISDDAIEQSIYIEGFSDDDDLRWYRRFFKP